MRVLVTGATGFLGSHLVKSLVKDGFEVIILKRSTSNCYRIHESLPYIKIYDLDKTSIETPFRDFKGIDAVIHTATCYGRNNEDDSEIIKSNLIFPIELFKTAASFQTNVFINTDTFSRSVINDYLVGYNLTKSFFLEWGKHVSKNTHTTFINVQLEHLYGPNDSDAKFVPNIITNCLANVPEFHLTPAHQKRDFIYVDDAVMAFLTILKNLSMLNDSFFEYQLGTGTVTSIREFVQLVHELTNSSTILKFGALPYRNNEIMFSKADNKSLRELGWLHKTGLREGVLKIIGKA